MSVEIMSRVWKQSKQGGSQLLLLLAIADNANDVGVAWPGQSYLAGKIKMSKRSIPRIASKLRDQGYLFINDRSADGRVTQYIVTLGMNEEDFEKAIKVYLKFSVSPAQEAMKWFNNRGGRQVVTPDIAVSGGDDTAMSGGVDTAMSGGDDIAVSTKPSITINEPSFKKISAKADSFLLTNEDVEEMEKKIADYSSPISLLSEKEVRELKLPLSAWQQYLTDEQAERQRKGIISFLEKKIATGPLLPDTPAAHILFDKLAIEAEAKGRRPPQKFPTLAVKDKFGKAASNLNGTLEAAINKALESGITAIPRIVNYISSPKWRESNDKHKQGSTKARQREATGNARIHQPGNGRTPEMQAKIDAIGGATVTPKFG